MAAQPPVCEFGQAAIPFSLPATDGKTYGLTEIAGPKGTLIVFMCNHCPYVQSIIDRLDQTARELQALGVGVAGICSNDARAYPADSFDKMKDWAIEHDFCFPYLWDQDQSVAKAFGAICTPDFFGYNASLELQYRGRLDESRIQLISNAKPELLLAMKQIAETGLGPKNQIPSMGCSIKWKAA